MKTVLFQGDSITDAFRLRDNDLYLGSGYPNLVAACLGVTRPGEFRFLNRGISGNRSIDLLARVKTDILALKPDYLSILIGVNDVWHELEIGNGVEEAWFERYYDLLVTQIRETLPECRILILEPFVLKGTATEAHWDYFRREVEARARASGRVAQKHGLPFVPLMGRFDRAQELADASYWLSDGVHPTAMGHEIIKEAWLEAFARLEG